MTFNIIQVITGWLLLLVLIFNGSKEMFMYSQMRMHNTYLCDWFLFYIWFIALLRAASYWFQGLIWQCCGLLVVECGSIHMERPTTRATLFPPSKVLHIP